MPNNLQKIMRFLAGHSLLVRTTEDCIEIASKTISKIITFLSTLIFASLLTVISSKYTGENLFLVTLFGGLIGFVIPWVVFFIYCIFIPTPHFRVGLGTLSGSSEDIFGITRISENYHHGLGNLEIKAKMPDGTVQNWLAIPYQTFCGGQTIFLTTFPQTWPVQEGTFQLHWRSTTWGKPPLTIVKAKFDYKNGEWIEN